jgi:hypothetical protein
VIEVVGMAMRNYPDGGGHGREGTCTLRAVVAPSTIKEIWPGSFLIIWVKAAGAREGRAINETRYVVTSLRTTGKALLG